MNTLTHAAKALTLSLSLLLATVTLACGCAVGTESTEEPGTVDSEPVDQAHQEINGVINPGCGPCCHYDSGSGQCLCAPSTSTCWLAYPGNG
jgi:hypothetical protein